MPTLDPAYDSPKVTVYAGDCLDILRELPDASVHAVVCDPPYGLANTTPEQVADTLVRWVNGDRDYIPKGSGFMGRSWDAFVPPVAVWDECIRVLPPGGHLLAFAGSRTHDLMTLGIRLAGFEIRDTIAYLYGSGFPKSLDVSKAIDKARDEDDGPTRAVAAYLLACVKASPLSQREVEERLGLGFNSLCNFIQPNRKTFKVPRWDLWQQMKAVIGFGDDMDAEVRRLDARKSQLGDDWRDAEVIGVREGAMSGWSMDGSTRFVDRELKAPATDAARQWQGWGTALRPSHEPIVVARKPLSGTVASTVLAYGTGAINVDGCRVAGDVPQTVRGSGGAYSREAQAAAGYRPAGAPYSRQQSGVPVTPHAAGRWPANVVLDGAAADQLDQEVGERPTGALRPYSEQHENASSYQMQRDKTFEQDASTGGPSRFFPVFRYAAKAGADERPSYTRDGAGEGRVIEGASGKVRQCNVCGNRTIRSGETAPACGHADFSFVPTAARSDRVAHPTVKPLELMRWLVRLVTPPGGVVLDPFAGSGTTLEAALLEGFRAIGVEREPDYLPLIVQRLNRRQDPAAYLRGKAADDPDVDLGLFGLLDGDGAA